MYKAETLSPCGFRADGRLVHEARQLRCRTSVPPASSIDDSAVVPGAQEGAAAAAGAAGCPTNCDGRAVVSLGCTKVMALVYGPQPVTSCNTASNVGSNWSVSTSDGATASLQLPQEGRQGNSGRAEIAPPLSVVCSVGFVDSCIRLRSMYTPDAAEVAATVRAAAEGVILRRYTQARITISILVLADDGGIMSASLIAASLALADAGVPMSDLLPACTVMLLPQHQPQQQQQLLLDPTSDEARTGGPSLTIGVTAHTGDNCAMINRYSSAQNSSVIVHEDICTRMPAFISPDMACLDVHLRVPHSFSSQIVALQLSGKVDKEAYAKMFELCLRGCAAVAECMKVDPIFFSKWSTTEVHPVWRVTLGARSGYAAHTAMNLKTMLCVMPPIGGCYLAADIFNLGASENSRACQHPDECTLLQLK